MPRVRMFCDWDNDSAGLIDRLKMQTDGFAGHDYKGLNFVSDDSYTHAICFNFPTYDLKTPADKNVALILEPPELVASMFSKERKMTFKNVREIFSFAADVYTPAFGLGFATVPDMTYPELLSKSNRVCMIVSNKLMTPYHHKRQKIKDALLETDLPIDFYGRGLTGDDPRIMGEIPPMSKYAVLSRYQMCIDFENSPHCAVTDKFFDPVLCNTIPISNAAVLHSLIDQDSFHYINFDLPIKDIVENIGCIVNEWQVDQDDANALLATKKEIRSGSLCLAEWIFARVRESI